MSSLEKCSVEGLCPVLVGLFLFLVLSFRSSFCVLVIIALSDM